MEWLKGATLLLAAGVEAAAAAMIGLAALEASLRALLLFVPHQEPRDGHGRCTDLDRNRPASFWLADAYVLQGRMDEARTLFARLLALRNDLGLLAEEYDHGRKRQVGNFPQAFSHLALIGTAHYLTDAAGPAHRRAAGAPMTRTPNP